MSITTYATVKITLDDRPPAIHTPINRDNLIPKTTKEIILITPKYFETSFFILFKLTQEKSSDEKDIKILAVLEILQFNESISIQKYQTTESASFVSMIFILSSLKCFNFQDIYVFSRPTNNIIFPRTGCLKYERLIEYWEEILNNIDLIEPQPMSLHKFRDISDIKNIYCQSRVLFPNTPEYKTMEHVRPDFIKRDPGFDIFQIKKRIFYESIIYRQDFLGSAIFLIRKTYTDVNTTESKNNILVKTNVKNKEEVLTSINILAENCTKIKSKQNPLKYLKKLTPENNIYLVWDLIDNYQLKISDVKITENFIKETKLPTEVISIKINTNLCHAEPQ
ncbi:hypothetical protein CDIK_0294 [Cucumispora dikerogammari]|nr:hypothetical protein CDIK_0294 [Cucumispora dikerogammari]